MAGNLNSGLSYLIRTVINQEGVPTSYYRVNELSSQTPSLEIDLNLVNMFKKGPALLGTESEYDLGNKC